MRIGPLTVGAVLAVWLAAAQAEGERITTGFFKHGPEAELEAAIRGDDRLGIGKAIAAGAQVNARGLRNVTPLMIALDTLDNIFARVPMPVLASHRAR